MNNQHINYIVAKLRAAGISLKLVTTANREHIYSILGRRADTKVVIDPVTLDVEVLDWDGETFRILDRGFFINPFRMDITVERIEKCLA